MYQDIGVSPDGAGEVGVQRDVQGIMSVQFLVLQATGAEIQSVLKQTYPLISVLLISILTNSSGPSAISII